MANARCLWSAGMLKHSTFPNHCCTGAPYTVVVHCLLAGSHAVQSNLSYYAMGTSCCPIVLDPAGTVWTCVNCKLQCHYKQRFSGTIFVSLMVTLVQRSFIHAGFGPVCCSGNTVQIWLIPCGKFSAHLLAVSFILKGKTSSNTLTGILSKPENQFIIEDKTNRK